MSIPTKGLLIFVAACNCALAANIEMEEEVQLDGICMDSILWSI